MQVSKIDRESLIENIKNSDIKGLNNLEIDQSDKELMFIFESRKRKLLEDKEKWNQTVNYQIGQIPSSVEVFTPKHSITELAQTVDKDVVEAAIFQIAGKYLNSNVKGRSITDKFTVDLLIEHFFTECGNLELQEIEFIFKNGIKGVFGIIYNDISIDTICGCDGWIEQYYNKFRKLRPERTAQEHTPNFTGNEMTHEQFLKKYPELKVRNELSEILLKAKTFKLKLDDVKIFYEIKGLNKVDDLQEDMMVFSKKYFQLDDDIRSSITELQFILMGFAKFIISNYNKTKE